MAILNKTVAVLWHESNRKNFESLGYPFTAYGDSFEVPIKQADSTCTQTVDFECPVCKKRETLTLWHAKRQVACFPCSLQMADQRSEKRKRKQK